MNLLLKFKHSKFQRIKQPTNINKSKTTKALNRLI